MNLFELCSNEIIIIIYFLLVSKNTKAERMHNLFFLINFASLLPLLHSHYIPS